MLQCLKNRSTLRGTDSSNISYSKFIPYIYIYIYKHHHWSLTHCKTVLPQIFWTSIRFLLRCGDINNHYLHIFLNVGDTGADQAASRGSLRTMFAKRADFSNVMFLGLGCLKHQYHLITSGQLKLTDHILRVAGKKVKYFSSLATMSHTWRAYLSRMRNTWSKLHGGTRTEQNKNIVFKTPPLAIAGRWASIDGN